MIVTGGPADSATPDGTDTTQQFRFAVALLKRNSEDNTVRPATATGGRPLFLFFLPAVIVGILLMLLIAVLAQQAVTRAAADAARASATSAAEALAARIEGEVLARRSLITLALAGDEVVRALAAAETAAIDNLEAAIQRRIDGLLQVRLLQPDANQPDPSGAAPLGYAGLDMLRGVVETGQPSPAEIHQIKSGLPYLAFAMPVKADGRTVGVLFAAWDMRFLVRIVENAPAIQGRLALVQGGEDGFVLAKGPGEFDGLFRDGSSPVPQSIWELNVAVVPQVPGLGNLMMLLAIAGGGGLALLLIAFLQWRTLSADIRADMTTIVGLGEAILKRESKPVGQPHLSSHRDAIALLGQYMRESRVSAVSGDAAATRQSVPATAVADTRLQGLEVEELANDPSEALGGAPQPAGFNVPESLFRAYDVRGVVGETVTDELAQALGQAVGSLVQDEGGTQVAVACDTRLSSPSLVQALIRGLAASGCHVIDLGQAPTPLLYFALHTQPVQGGVIVTGSHNPTEYNGFKIVVGDRVIDGNELQALRQRIVDGAVRQGKGDVERLQLQEEYIEAVCREVQLTRPLKVVADAGNGAAGELAVATFEALGCEVVPLFCEPDGSFPNHHPDPSQPENLSALILEVQAQEADIGFAFDGDGDRLGVVDNEGQVVWADTVLMLLAADVLGRHPGVDVVYDVKSSRHLASFVLGHGGRPIMWRSGHSRMRAKMLETGALLGGEFSGHLFIKERWFGFDDAIFAAVRVLEIMALESRSASELFAELPSSPATPEYQLMLEEGQSSEIMRALDAHKVFDDARLVELDGLRVEFANGWGLIRPSGTIPSLSFRFEADDEDALAQIKTQFRELLRRVAPDLQAPF